MAAVVRLIDDAAVWLRTKGTDQWARPWPSQADRDSRVLAHLLDGKTWVCRDGKVTAATITADPDDDPYWSQPQPEPAVYIHRLVINREYAARGLGAELLNWAGSTARRRYGAIWIRVSVWTTNVGLHEYYRRQGFILCGYHADDGYPSGARFQKPTALIPEPSRLLFIQA